MKERRYLYVFTVVLFSIVILFSSCATKTRIEYRDRDVNHYVTKIVHDTLIDKTTDSVYYEVKVKGDTVFATKYKELTRWKERIVEKHDTCFKDSVETVYVETVKEVQKIPNIFLITYIFSIICIIFALVKFVRWVQIR